MVAEICDEFGRKDPVVMYAKLLFQPDCHQERIAQTMGARAKLQEVCDKNGIQIAQVNLIGVGASVGKGDRSDYGGMSFIDVVRTVLAMGFVIVIAFRIGEILLGGA